VLIDSSDFIAPEMVRISCGRSEKGRVDCATHDASAQLTDERGYSRMVDYWAMGVLVFEMLWVYPCCE
jgi:hypothetical protein